MSDLKRCPFCGSSDLSPEPEFGPQQHWLCSGCGSCATVERWNTRVSPWRSLKDDPPTEYPVVVFNPRKKSADVLLFKATHETLGRGWTLWMEIPG